MAKKKADGERNMSKKVEVAKKLLKKLNGLKIEVSVQRDRQLRVGSNELRNWIGTFVRRLKSDGSVCRRQTLKSRGIRYGAAGF